ncbi:MAG: hypothetical protein JW749_00510 [Sedimentisphaerales bacterium]|nr:hypothetical protein [Sedimentisphaerales bacterium]
MNNPDTTSAIIRRVFILTSCCLLVGCSQTPQKRGLTGFPVRVGIQGEEPLPVHLHSDANNTVFVEFKPSAVTLPVKLQVGPNEPLPVALLLENGQVLPVEIKAEANSPLAVELQNKILTVELNIKDPLPVALNIPSRILIFAGISIAAIIAVCIAISCLCYRKQT